jgi:hypothetical protein
MRVITVVNCAEPTTRWKTVCNASDYFATVGRVESPQEKVGEAADYFRIGGG